MWLWRFREKHGKAITISDGFPKCWGGFLEKLRNWRSLSLKPHPAFTMTIDIRAHPQVEHTDDVFCLQKTHGFSTPNGGCWPTEEERSWQINHNGGDFAPLIFRPPSPQIISQVPRPSFFWKSTIFSKMPRRLKNHATKQAQTAQKTAKKTNSNHLSNYWCFAFFRNDFAFFSHLYIYIYVVFFLSFCECQFQLHSQSLCILSPHFVLRCVFFWGGAIWKKHSGKNRGAQSQAMVPSPHIRSSISHDPFWLWLHRRTAPRSSLKKWDSSNGWADGRLWLSGGAPGPSSWLAKLPKSSLGSLLGFCWLWLWPLVSWMGEHEPTTHT